MSFFKNLFRGLFGKNETPAPTPVTAPETPPAQEPPVPKDLFIEQQHPSEIDALFNRKATKRQPETILGELMERDYFSLGEKEGYEMADLDMMDIGVSNIKIAFRNELQKALSDLEDVILENESHLTPRLQEEMPEIFKKIDLRNKKLNRQKEQLINQLDLVQLGEGFVEQSLLQYRQGFRRGYLHFCDAELLFDTPKTIKL